MTAEDELFDAVRQRDEHAVKRLINAHVNVNAISDNEQDLHRTPLHLCVWDNFIEGAKLLIDAGADVNILDDLHDTPFLLSGAQGRFEILQHIYDHADFLRRSKTGTPQSIKAATPDYAIVNRFGGSALIPACERGHVRVVDLLLRNGIDVNHYNYYKWTGLLEVIELGGDDRDHVEITQLLIKAGVDVNQVDGNGQTPLKLARKYGFKRICKLLEEAGAHE